MSNNFPLVSIIMPAFNAESTIASSIQSVIAQSYINWELLIVDDGSKDRTRQVIKPHLSDPRIFYFFQTNSGVASARNLGLTRSKGRYIAFLDSDDQWLPFKLDLQVAEMETDSNIRLLFTDFYSRSAENNSLKRISFRDRYRIPNDYHRLLVFDYIGTLTVLLRADVVRETGRFDTTLFGTEDWDYWIRVAANGPIKHISQRTAVYLNNGQGISKSYRRHLRNMRSVIDKHVCANSLLPPFVRQMSEVLYRWTSLIYSLRSADLMQALLDVGRILAVMPKSCWVVLRRRG